MKCAHTNKNMKRPGKEKQKCLTKEERRIVDKKVLNLIATPALIGALSDGPYMKGFL